MKNIFAAFILSSVLMSASAQQVNDMVSMTAGYSEQVFYSLSDGEVGTASLAAWDFAFTTNPFDAAIFVNDNLGIQIYEYLGPIADWETLDTAGMLSEPLHNSELNWSEGAFNRSQTLSGTPFDYGWGQYNPITHIVNGNRIFIMDFLDGSSRKMLIQSLNLGVFTVKYAMLDGSAEQTLTVDGGDYGTKNFWYLDIETATVLDLEPDADSWDISFTRYSSEIIPGAYYIVAGALQNKDIEATEAAGLPANEAIWTDYTMSADKNIIGYDWKYFNMETFSWELPDSLSYFVKDQAGNVWQIAFTGFGGSSTGNIEFTKELVSITSLDEYERMAIQVFPNPNDGNFQWILPADMEGAT